MMLIEKLLFMLTVHVALFIARAQTAVEDNLSKHLKVSDFNCTEDELKDFISSIESVLNGTLPTLSEFIKGEKNMQLYDFSVIDVTYGGRQIAVEMTRDDLDVVFSYEFHPNPDRVSGLL